MNMYVDEIKTSVTMKDVFRKYGFEANRSGFIKCPFHREKTASLKIYDNDRKFKCFGCGEGGSVIDFVEKLFNLTFQEAITRINYDFGLNLPLGKKLSIREQQKLRKELKEKQLQLAKIKAEKDKKEEEYWLLWSEWIFLDKAIRNYAPKTEDEELHPMYVASLHRITYLNYLMEALL